MRILAFDSTALEGEGTFGTTLLWRGLEKERQERQDKAERCGRPMGLHFEARGHLGHLLLGGLLLDLGSPTRNAIGRYTQIPPQLNLRSKRAPWNETISGSRTQHGHRDISSQRALFVNADCASFLDRRPDC